MMIEFTHYLFMGLAGYLSLFNNVPALIIYRTGLSSNDITMQIGRIFMIVHIFFGNYILNFTFLKLNKFNKLLTLQACLNKSFQEEIV